MTTFFVSRHPGAVEWARAQALDVDRWESHLNLENVKAADTVVGTLPIQIAAAVCARGAQYLHLSVDLPAAWRGRELSCAELVQAGARLEHYTVVGTVPARIECERTEVVEPATPQETSTYGVDTSSQRFQPKEKP